MTKAEVRQQAMALSDEERVALANELLRSVPVKPCLDGDGPRPGLDPKHVFEQVSTSRNSIPDEILSTANPFCALPPEDRQHLAACCEMKSFKSGEAIVHEADPSEYFYTIVTGRVKVFKTSPSGKEVIWGVFGSGDPIGSVAVFKELPYPASVAALEDTVCVSISRSNLFALLERHPSIARGFLLGLTQRLVELVNRVGELSGARVAPRMARLFLRLSEESGREERGGVFIPLPFSRQELAGMTGTTIETCVRVMSKWEKEDTVHTIKDGFVVLDGATLRNLADS